MKTFWITFTRSLTFSHLYFRRLFISVPFKNVCLLLSFNLATSFAIFHNLSIWEIGLIILVDTDLHSPASNRSSPANQEGGLHWTAFPDVVKANQPPGQMMWKKYGDSLPGFEGCGTFAVTFTFYDGIQTSEHPSPGEMYRGMSCIAYLPDTQEGRQVLKLLLKAFDARLVFTVSKSASDPTGQVALNGVELKTSAESDAR